MDTSRITCFTIIICTLFLACEGCTPDQIVRGCMIQSRQCFCGMGCRSEFRYKNRDECKMALNGDTKDACKSNPCANNGACIQTTTTFSQYKCRCEGTGYYGVRCQHACSELNHRGKVFPYECIEI